MHDAAELPQLLLPFNVTGRITLYSSLLSRLPQHEVRKLTMASRAGFSIQGDKNEGLKLKAILDITLEADL